jgi:transposase
VAKEVSERMRALIVSDPEAPRLEILRQLREEGMELGESTFYRLHRKEREALPKALLVRFEGVAGEFAQFDFGEVDVRLTDGRKKRVHFAAYRLKYSRWMSVVLVPDERVESLIRALLGSFEGSGGVPLRVVFDRPKTVVMGQDNGRPIWNTTLAQTAIDYGFTIELCAPRSPEQKGSVENLVGFVKRRFFRARRFTDLDKDLPRQLLEWLVEVNEERPNRATQEVPKLRLAAEQKRMKPLAVAPAEYPLRYPVQVGPTALVEFGGVRYAMPAGACGIPATLHLFPDRVRIVTSGGPVRGRASAFSSRWAYQLPVGTACRTTRVRGRRPQAALLHERADPGAGTGRRGLPHRAHPRAASHLEG